MTSNASSLSLAVKDTGGTYGLYIKPGSVTVLLLLVLMLGWGGNVAADDYTVNTRIRDVISDPVFLGYGRLIFPVDKPIGATLTLAKVDSLLPWYSHVNQARTVEIVNYLKARAGSGEKIFFDIYTEKEQAADPAKKNTGLFLFRGKPDAKVAVLNAGGGFRYVAAMHDSFPQALELSRRGYNAFALIYRPGADTACEDLARAIAFIHQYARELRVEPRDYSLWGGSAGGRMVAWVSSHGTKTYGEKSYPKPAAVIMQYTALHEVSGNEPPSYACVGTADSISSARSMETRIKRIKAQGTNAVIEIFPGLHHGFGLGEGTIAEGWLDRAVSFWERQMKRSENVKYDP